MSQPADPLEKVNVPEVLQALAVHYGDAWIRKWDGVPADMLLADWQRHIGDFPRAAAAHALGKLPLEYPPNASIFRALCLSWPGRPQARLPAPKADPSRVRRELAAIYRRLNVKPPWERGQDEEIPNLDERKREAAAKVEAYQNRDA